MSPMTEVLYRKYRPQSFAEVAGQDVVTRTLRNSVASGRLAHAYLFCGPRGTGKTSLGRLLAKAANCSAPVDGEPCNICDSCVSYNEGRAMDFVEQDAASHNGVEDIRTLRENVALSPMAGGRKVYLLDEAHMLSPAAVNALLKTLEEPPPHVIFVLATTEAHKILPTIISRCQRFDLKRIPLPATVDRLAFIAENENFTLDRASLEEIARASTGSLRDAVNGLEQVVSYYGASPSNDEVREALGLTMDARSGQLARAALAGDVSGALLVIAEVRDDGLDIKTFAKQVAKYLRGLLLAKSGVTDSFDLPREMTEEVREEAASLPREQIARALQAFGRIDWKEDSQTTLPLELALIDYVTQSEATAAAPARPEKPRETAPQRPSAPKREPQFSIPAADLDAVESTVATTTVLSPPASDAPPVEAPEPPVRVDAEAAPGSDGSGQRSDSILDNVRRALYDTDRSLAALLNGSCEVKSTEGDTVVLGFYHTFHLERAETSNYRPALEEAFSAELGRPVTVKYEHSPQQPRPDAPRNTPKGGHLVQAAREMGARALPPED
jgi:DNA polymerase III subunit gamma/tau